MATTHPFAAAGGGTHFECKVVCLYAVDLLCIRSAHLGGSGGLIASLRPQFGPAGFEDVTVELERADGSPALVHVQCRHLQKLTGSDAKFTTLLGQAWAAVCADPVAYASRQHSLLLVVDERSPGHGSFTDLCRLARESPTAEQFARAVTEHGGAVADRLEHCQTASGLSPDDLHATLAALDLHAVALDNPNSRDAVELVNRLQLLWSPVDLARAQDLANALFAYVFDLVKRTAAIDLDSLKKNLTANLPGTMGAGTRRARLHRLREEGEARVVQRLRALGVDDPRAVEIARQALEEPPRPLDGPVVVIDGLMGVGKTTELERQHRHAILSALDDPTRPIPIFTRARDIAHTPLRTLIEHGTNGLGDPAKVGVHLSIDGLDEAGLTVEDVARHVAGADAQWPNTTVVLATRPQPEVPGTPTVRVHPLSDDQARQLMTVIHPESPHRPPVRPELGDILCLPLFAISYAVDRRDGVITHPAKLVASVGQRAVRDLDPDDDKSFTLLCDLACAIIDSGGQPARLDTLSTNPLHIARVARARVIEVSGGRATFQLAALTEWFAARRILQDDTYVTQCVRTPLAAYRWRYALAQALRQGSDATADRIMTELIQRAPATAAWVHAEAAEPFGADRTTPLPGTTLEVGARIRHASTHWLEPWPTIRAARTHDGELPVLGITVREQPNGSSWITRAWRTGPPESAPVVALPNDSTLPDDVWPKMTDGSVSDGPLWTWSWTRGDYQKAIDDLLGKRDSLAGVSVCWDELAWDYAHLILDRSPDVQANPIRLDDLEAHLDRQSKIAARYAPTAHEVWVGGLSRRWRLSEGRAFVEDLQRLGMSQIESPWPAANRHGQGGGWITTWWTTEQLLARLHRATKAALDAYRELVEQVVPTMAPEVSTYQLLPARVVGEITEGDPAKGMLGQPRFSWHLEPLEDGSENEATWRVVDRPRGISRDRWQEMAALYRQRRGELPLLRGLTIHDGEPHIYSSTPAGSLALTLLAFDLAEFRWTARSRLVDANAGSTRPVGR